MSFSRTALLVAAYRARASAREDAICHDPHAAVLAGDDGHAFARSYDQVNPHLELWVSLRTAAIDAEVRAAMKDGIGQIVILGAGLDTRAARLGRPGVRFFEVDRPETQAEKIRRLALLEGYPHEAATYVTCNFENEDFLTRLVDSGFHVNEPALFVWEGVTYYLTEPAVRATLRRIAEGTHPRSRVVFDYVGKRFVEGRLKDERDLAARDYVAKLGEPFVFGTNDVLPLLYEVGFRHVRNDTFDELCLTWTGTYERERRFRFQYLAAASRTPPPLV